MQPMKTELKILKIYFFCFIFLFIIIINYYQLDKTQSKQIKLLWIAKQPQTSNHWERNNMLRSSYK